MSLLYNAVHMQLLVVFYLVDSYLVQILVNIRFEVWISSALFHLVAKFLAANAPLVPLQLCHFFLLFLLCLIDFLFIVFGLMLSKLAPREVFSCFAAAPPHFATPLRLMCPAWPVKVLFLIEFLSTVFAWFLIAVKLAFFLNEPGNTLLQLISFFDQQFVHFLIAKSSIYKFFIFIRQKFDFLLKSCDFLFILGNQYVFFLDKGLFHSAKILSFISKSVPLCLKSCNCLLLIWNLIFHLISESVKLLYCLLKSLSVLFVSRYVVNRFVEYFKLLLHVKYGMLWHLRSHFIIVVLVADTFKLTSVEPKLFRELFTHRLAQDCNIRKFLSLAFLLD